MPPLKALKLFNCYESTEPHLTFEYLGAGIFAFLVLTSSAIVLRDL